MRVTFIISLLLLGQCSNPENAYYFKLGEWKRVEQLTSIQPAPNEKQMRMKALFICMCIFSLISCGQMNSLSPGELEWMPYKGNENLVFNSNSNGADTIFLLKKDTLIAYPEAQKINGIKYEVVSVFCQHSDLGPMKDELSYIESNFLELKKNINNHATLAIYLKTKDAFYFSVEGSRIDNLKNTPPLVFQTRYDRYNDVYMLQAVDHLGISDRSEYVTKVYWSKSKGLIRFDKKDGTYWELAQVY